jgi:cbb3-type cytochrome oxidase subunit 3
MNVGFTVVWLVVVYLLYREHKRLSLEQEAAQAQAAA